MTDSPDKTELSLDRDIQPAPKLSFGKPAARPKPPKTSTKKQKRARYNKEGLTALMRAVIHDDVDAVKTCLEKGYDPNQLSREDDSVSALSIAVQTRSNDIAKLLVNAGADIIENDIDLSINWMIGIGKSDPPHERIAFTLIDGWIKQGNTGKALSGYLHNAAHANDTNLLEKLVRVGADINHIRHWEMPYSLYKADVSPIEVAARSGSQAALLKLFVLGADPQTGMDAMQRCRQVGDDPLETTPLGVIAEHFARTGKVLTEKEAEKVSYKNLFNHLSQSPPPAFKYGRPITKSNLEAYILKTRRRRRPGT